MLNRTGHFLEKRYHSTGSPMTDKQRALNTLRYIHGNPKAADMQQGWFYDFSNYGTYDRLTIDGITQWHPAFLALGTTLDICAETYHKFCKKYKPQPKVERKSTWGSKLLEGFKPIKKSQKKSPGQMSLWDEREIPLGEIEEVAKKFVLANSFDPQRAIEQFPDRSSVSLTETGAVPRGRVSLRNPTTEGITSEEFS